MKYRYTGQSHICLFDAGAQKTEWQFVGFSDGKPERSEFAETEIIVPLDHCAEAAEAFKLLGITPMEMAKKIALLKESFRDVQNATCNYVQAAEHEKSSLYSRLISVQDRHYQILMLNY